MRSVVVCSRLLLRSMSIAAVIMMLAGTLIAPTTTAFMVSAPRGFLGALYSRPDAVRSPSGMDGTSWTGFVSSTNGSSRSRLFSYVAHSRLCGAPYRSMSDDSHHDSRRPQGIRAAYHDSDMSDFVGGSSMEHDEPVYRRTRRAREQQLVRHSSTTATSECKNAPDEDNVWRQSVFEFKGLNDPNTNLASSTRAPSGETPPTASGDADQADAVAVDDAPTPINAASFPDKYQNPEWFQFREKEALSRAEVDDKVKQLRGAHSATVELATQLGLPACTPFEEIRTAYRMEIKRCHPDAAGFASNEFRLKALERRFQRLTTSWDAFVAAHKHPSRFGVPLEGPDPTTNPVAAAVAKRAARQASGTMPATPTDAIDDDRENLDVGGSSC